jgi:hypothetical protein
MTAESQVRYEMSISYETFMRNLPDLLEDTSYSVEGRMIEAKWSDRSLTIRLSPEGERELGLMELPVTIVTLDFQGFSAEQQSQFLERFREHYMRGAGGP